MATISSHRIFAVRMLDLGRGELNRLGISICGELVNDRTAGISQTEQLGDFVESFSRSIVAGVSYVPIKPALALLLCQIEMRMSTGHHQCEHRKIQFVVSLLPLFEQHGMDVTFEVVDRDQRLIESKRQGLGIADTNEQCAGEAGAL